MQYQLIKLQDKFIIVSNQEIKEGDLFITNTNNVYTANQIDNNFAEDFGHDRYINLINTQAKKIIAGIPELPTIDFSLLCEADCKTIGWVDVEKLGLTINGWVRSGLANRLSEGGERELKGWVEGFKTAQSLNDNDKMFSFKDMKNAFMTGISHPKDETRSKEQVWNRFIQSLQQTVWNVEVEMEAYTVGEMSKLPLGTRNSKPKITNNSVKVTKLI